MFSNDSGNHVTLQIVRRRSLHAIWRRKPGEDGHCANLSPCSEVTQHIFATLKLRQSKCCRFVAKTNLRAMHFNRRSTTAVNLYRSCSGWIDPAQGASTSGCAVVQGPDISRVGALGISTV